MMTNKIGVRSLIQCIKALLTDSTVVAHATFEDGQLICDQYNGILINSTWIKSHIPINEEYECEACKERDARASILIKAKR